MGVFMRTSPGRHLARRLRAGHHRFELGDLAPETRDLVARRHAGRLEGLPGLVGDHAAQRALLLARDLGDTVRDLLSVGLRHLAAFDELAAQARELLTGHLEHAYAHQECVLHEPRDVDGHLFLVFRHQVPPHICPRNLTLMVYPRAAVPEYGEKPELSPLTAARAYCLRRTWSILPADATGRGKIRLREDVRTLGAE